MRFQRLRNYLYLNHPQKSAYGGRLWKIALEKMPSGRCRAGIEKAVRSDLNGFSKPAYLRMPQFLPKIGRPNSLGHQK